MSSDNKKATKTVPISIRVSQEDAEFIANLNVEGAITPSDKIRNIIKEAREVKEQVVTYEGCLKIAQNTLKELVQKIKINELEQKQYSELINIFNDWITEAFAYLASVKNELNEQKISLSHLEEGIAERVFRLFEIVTRMGVTAKAPCYDKSIIIKGFTPMLELIDIINQNLKKEKKND